VKATLRTFGCVIQGFAQHRAITRDDIDYTGRNQIGDVGNELHHRQAGDFSRLQHDGAARCQRGRELKEAMSSGTFQE